MAEPAVAVPVRPVGRIVAEAVPFDDYLGNYAEHFHEWVRGYVIEMSPVALRHERIVAYLRMLLNAWLARKTVPGRTPIGVLVGMPFVMRTDVAPSGRLPDLQLVLETNPGDLTETVMLGPADLCVEVVSPESVTRDYREKLAEYEEAGVREYWLIDPFRTQARFHRLNDDGAYVLHEPDEHGDYTTPLLPGLVLTVPVLWQTPLPDFFAIARTVEAMDIT
ncbi:MAG: Uma2 family endonuclease [Spirochaetaceae bacterium]|nr:Uma2 family endonuclease [Spirochaetaceae bacterium]